MTSWSIGLHMNKHAVIYKRQRIQYVVVMVACFIEITSYVNLHN